LPAKKIDGWHLYGILVRISEYPDKFPSSNSSTSAGDLERQIDEKKGTSSLPGLLDQTTVKKARPPMTTLSSIFFHQTDTLWNIEAENLPKNVP
jgi:hypothetical protein